MVAKLTLGRQAEAVGETVYASEARTATPTPVSVKSTAQAVEIVVDVTAITSTPSVVFNVERQDRASGKWVLLLASAALAAVATTRLRISPHLAAAANLVAQDHASGLLRVRPVHGNANSITYTVGMTALE